MNYLGELLHYLKGNESESKSQLCRVTDFLTTCCCVTSKVMNMKANHNQGDCGELPNQVVALPQR